MILVTPWGMTTNSNKITNLIKFLDSLFLLESTRQKYTKVFKLGIGNPLGDGYNIQKIANYIKILDFSWNFGQI